MTGRCPLCTHHDTRHDFYGCRDCPCDRPVIDGNRLPPPEAPGPRLRGPLRSLDGRAGFRRRGKARSLDDYSEFD